MRAYYDSGSGELLYTMSLAPGMTGPSGAFIEIEEQDLTLHQWRVEDGVLVPRSELMLVEARASAIARVNAVSGEVRSRFITVIPGQEMLYLLKEREAIRWLEERAAEEADPPGPAPSIDAFELIRAEIGITGQDADQVAQIYVNMAAQLRQIAAQLETLRLGTVMVIEGAADAASIEAALAQFLGAIQ